MTAKTLAAEGRQPSVELCWGDPVISHLCFPGLRRSGQARKLAGGGDTAERRAPGRMLRACRRV